MTLRVTVFDVTLPFFGVTVTVTLQEPAFNPLSAAPDTLQFFAVVRTTFIETFEVGGTLSFASAAIDIADLDRDNVRINTWFFGTELKDVLSRTKTVRDGFGTE